MSADVNNALFHFSHDVFDCGTCNPVTKYDMLIYVARWHCYTKTTFCSHFTYTTSLIRRTECIMHVYLHAKWHLDASNRLATIEMGRKLGRELRPLFGDWSWVPISVVCLSVLCTWGRGLAYPRPQHEGRQ